MRYDGRSQTTCSQRGTPVRRRFAVLVVARSAVLGLIVLVLGYEVISLVAQIGTPQPDFASTYVAARAAVEFPGASVYNYGALLGINTARGYVTGGFYPFTAPPFSLLAFAPLALLPYTTASVIWLALVRLCVLGTAFLLADACTLAVEGRAASEWTAGNRWRSGLRSTALRVGKHRFPAAPFAIFAALLALGLPSLDTVYWGQMALIAVLLVALALNATLRQRPYVAGVSIALASGFSFLPLVLLGVFIARSAWKAAGALILFAGAVAALPLIFFPVREYTDLLAASRFHQSVYVASGHNVSLIGAVTNLIEYLGHMGTRTFMQAERLGGLLALALSGIVVGVLALAAVLRAWLSRREEPSGADGVTWVCAAFTLSAAVLATPLVWPSDSAFSLVATLLIGSYAVIRLGDEKAGWRVGLVLVLGMALVALLLQVSAVLFGLDRATLPLQDARQIVYLALPAAALVTWVVACGALLLPYCRIVWRRLRPATASAEAQAASGVEPSRAG